MKVAIKKEKEVIVPCDECKACCNSSYFIHIEPSETQTLSHIPKKLLFPAPGLPKGNMLLGYNEKGCCPMFVKDKCSIYEYRPQTCRQFDCRVFPATGLELYDEGRSLISDQAKRWKFDISTEQDLKEFKAVQAAAKFLIEYADIIPNEIVPRNTTQLAVLAICVYEVFLTCHETGGIDVKGIIESIVSAYESNKEGLALK